MTATSTRASQPANRRSCPRSLRALWRPLGIVAVAAVLVGGLSARPAQAHIPIILLVTAPQDGQTVGPNPQAVIYAQRTLGGIDQVAYTLTLDQHPIDPASGRVGVARPAQIHAGQQAHVSLHDLTPGRHQLAVRYRPDKDKPATSDAVAFTVRAPAPAGSRPTGAVLVAIALGLAAVAGATTWWARRRRTSRPARGRLPAGRPS